MPRARISVRRRRAAAARIRGRRLARKRARGSVLQSRRTSDWGTPPQRMKSASSIMTHVEDALFSEEATRTI